MSESTNETANISHRNTVSYREFGSKSSDLNLDLFQGSRPELITRILSHCQETTTDRMAEIPEEADGIWDLPVGERTRQLLSIGLAESPFIPLLLTCSQDGCNEPMEVELPLPPLLELHLERHDEGGGDGGDQEYVPIHLDEGTPDLEVRKPTGADQRNWLETAYATEQMAAEAMVRSLIRDRSTMSDVTPELIDEIDDAMSEADPLVNFGITTTCPSCGYEEHHSIDLDEIAIFALRKRQQQLIREVHLLASHYHWGEHEIMSLPAWRRRLYLSFIERQYDL